MIYAFSLFTTLVCVENVFCCELPFALPLWNWNYSDAVRGIMGVIPGQRQGNSASYNNACNSGHSQDLAYGCPHLLAFSTDALLAAAVEGLSGDFFYGTCARGMTSSCGECYQVRFSDPERASTNLTRQFILQVVNTGSDVDPGQFDVNVGAGGLGIFNACTSDCESRACSGGPCSSGLYAGTFLNWNPAGNQNCYSGGLCLVDAATLEDVWLACLGLLGNRRGYKDDVLLQSCYYSNALLLHQNFLTSESLRVQCPETLYRLTGLRRSDDTGLPFPHKDNYLPHVYSVGRGSHHRAITWYQDCCVPSCAYPADAPLDPAWSRVDVCDSGGFPKISSTAPETRPSIFPTP